jgi:hypothetical protein
MGFIDSRGVYIYDNDDQVIPHSTYMNLGQQSISDALAQLKIDLTVPYTPWTALSRVNVSTFSGDVFYARYGQVVTIRGALTGIAGPYTNLDGTGGISVTSALPSEIRPSGDFRVPQTGAAENTFTLNITSAGILSVYGYGPGSFSNGNTLRLYTSYII